VFCQQRGHNGHTSNPKYVQYGPTINSIFLSQTTSTSSGIIGNVDKFPFYKHGTLKKKHIRC
jgi:hypothetical protein